MVICVPCIATHSINVSWPSKLTHDSCSPSKTHGLLLCHNPALQQSYLPATPYASPNWVLPYCVGQDADQQDIRDLGQWVFQPGLAQRQKVGVEPGPQCSQCSTQCPQHHYEGYLPHIPPAWVQDQLPCSSTWVTLQHGFAVSQWQQKCYVAESLKQAQQLGSPQVVAACQS